MDASIHAGMTGFCHWLKHLANQKGLCEQNLQLPTLGGTDNIL
jgi:hypothetical protein